MGEDVWSAVIEFPTSSVGENLEFKFLNTADTWGDCGAQQECLADGEDDECKNPANDNRLLVIPAENTTLCFTWETCNGCNVSSTQESLLDFGMKVAPNPFNHQTVIRFGQSLDQAQVRLTSMTGQLVRSYVVTGDQMTIAKDGLQAGVYFLNVWTKDGVSAAEKLVVK